MNLYRLTVIVLRLWGIDLIINAPLRFIHLPDWMFGLFSQRLREFSSTRDEIGIGMLITRVILDLALGIYVIDASPSIARWLMGSVSTQIEALKHGADVWPPAPLQASLREPKFVSENGTALTIQKAATLLIKIDGLGWIADIFFRLSELPTNVFALIRYHSGYYGAEYFLSILATAADCLTALAIGLFFLMRPQRLVNWITQDLVQDAEAEERAATRQMDVQTPRLSGDSEPDASRS